MEQKNIKIVLFNFMMMLFCLEFVQAHPDFQDAIQKSEVFGQEVGTGFCTASQRFTELEQAEHNYNWSYKDLQLMATYFWCHFQTRHTKNTQSMRSR